MSQSTGYRYSYRFTDSSVPPDYHRSYEIIVENGEIRFAVDSYGDVLFSETIAINQDQMNDFITNLKACKLANKAETKDDGCTGGTGVSFSIQSSEMKPLDGFEYYCGAKSYGNLNGKVDEAVRAFKKLIPDFATKLDGTRK